MIVNRNILKTKTMVKASYSHAFLVGSFNGDTSKESLESSGWKASVISKDKYAEIIADYYKSHVDAMMEVEGRQEKGILNEVHHYCIPHQETNIDEKGNEVITKKGEKVSINFVKDGVPVKYSFFLCNIHLYIFPFDISLVAIEIYASDVDVEILTFAHRKLIDWKDNINEIVVGKFKTYLNPLANLLPRKDLGALVEDGNNMKIYQIIQIDDKYRNDKLLFEIATFSPIGSVCGQSADSHSKDYFNRLMNENSISTFSNWKALSLVDSFTVLAGDNFGCWQWINLYFPLIYIRCIFEKTFCFSRNNDYRQGKAKSTKKLSEEITEMEKYYFYSNISYNFQPNLLYEFMAKGVGIKTEREELSKQVKERAKKENEDKKEHEEDRHKIITLCLSTFAIFSVAWDLCSIIKEVRPELNGQCIASIILGCAIFLIFLLFLYILVLKKHGKE